MCIKMTYIICSYFKKFEIFSGAFAEHFPKIAHKVEKSKYFVDTSNELDSSINSFSNDKQFVGVSFVLQELSVGWGTPPQPPTTTSISYSVKVCTAFERRNWI